MEYKWKVLTVTTIGAFMVYLDSSIIVVGLPTVIEDLNTSLFVGIWMIAGYRLVLTILLVAIGRVADIVGRVKLYNAGFAVFTLGSVFCALSQTVEMLIAFRLVQGLGGALILASAISIITDSFPLSELGTATGIQIASMNAGTMAGYSLSGVMIGLFGWRSIFWLNVPIGLFATVWCHKRLKELSTKLPQQRFDYIGAVMFSTALTLLLLALTGDLRQLFSRILLGGSAVLFVVFLIFERQVDQPIMDMRLFKIRTFIAGNLSSMVNWLAFTALAFELTLYLQLIRSFSALEAGIALLPMDATMIFVGPVSGRLSDRYGARGLTAIGLGMMSAALLMFANLSLNSNLLFVTLSLALAGAGVGIFSSPNTSSVMASVPSESRGVANAVRGTISNSSIAVSIPLAMALMTMVLPYDKLSSIVSASTVANREEVLGLLSAMSFAFYVLAFINALGIISTIFRKSGHVPLK